MDSLSAYARQFLQPLSRPDVDSVHGVPPTVAIEQRVTRGGHNSTVATVTEVHHYLRLLFAKVGIQHCPNCDLRITSQTGEQILVRLLTDYRGEKVTLLAPAVRGRKGFHKDVLARGAAKGGFRGPGGWRNNVTGAAAPIGPLPGARYRRGCGDRPGGHSAAAGRAGSSGTGGCVWDRAPASPWRRDTRSTCTASSFSARRVTSASTISTRAYFRSTAVKGLVRNAVEPVCGMISNPHCCFRTAACLFDRGPWSCTVADRLRSATGRDCCGTLSGFWGSTLTCRSTGFGHDQRQAFWHGSDGRSGSFEGILPHCRRALGG